MFELKAFTAAQALSVENETEDNKTLFLISGDNLTLDFDIFSVYY